MPAQHHESSTRKTESTRQTPKSVPIQDLTSFENPPSRSLPLLTPNRVLALQRTYGNAFVQRMIRENRSITSAITPNQKRTIQPLMSKSDFEKQFTRFKAQEDAVKAIAVQIETFHGAEELMEKVEALSEIEKAVGELEEVLAGGKTEFDGKADIEGLKKQIKEDSEKLAADFAELMKGDDEEVDAEEAVKGKLEDNSFRVTAGLDTYMGTFGKAFMDAVTALKPDQNWLDGGAGLAVAMQDYFTRSSKSGKTPAKSVAFAYSRPKRDGKEMDKQVSDLEELEESDRFQYVETGKYFGAMRNDEIPGSDSGFDLITDHNGVLMYTQTLSEDLQRYLNLLKVNGTMFVSINPIDAKINGSAERAMVESWLGQTTGVTVTRTEATAWAIKRTSVDPIVVKKLTLTKYEQVEHSNAPHREFSM